MSPLMWVFSSIMILLFLLSLILVESNYIYDSGALRLNFSKDLINLKW